MSDSEMIVNLHPVVGPFLFFSSMCVVLAFGEDLNGISGRQMLSLSAFPIIVGYAAYACGFINGHHEGYMKAEDECRPNPSHHDGAAPAPSVDGVVGTLNQEGVK